jgi:hypothetical protein
MVGLRFGFSEETINYNLFNLVRTGELREK